MPSAKHSARKGAKVTTLKKLKRDIRSGDAKSGGSRLEASDRVFSVVS